jgi:Domain of unknown function (DUF397)
VDAVNSTPWIKSRRSADQGSCVEVQRLDDGSRRLRDSKDRGAGPILNFTQAEWEAFLDGVKKGEFD